MAAKPYTRRFNGRHGLWGHLFGGRYKAVVVEGGGSYFCRVLDYIHLNPARIGWGASSKGWSDYPYSSLLAYRGLRRPSWLSVARGFKLLGLKDNGSGRTKFLRRLQDRVEQEGMKEAGVLLPEGQSLQSTLSRGWQFGSDAFREEMLALAEKSLERMRGRRADGYRGLQMQDHGERHAEKLIATGKGSLKLLEIGATGARETGGNVCLASSFRNKLV